MNDDRSLRVHPDIVRFVQAAEVYCKLIETPHIDRNIWIRNVLIAVAELYAATHRLPIPDLDAASIDPEDRFRLSSTEYREAFVRLSLILDDERFYVDCSNITDFPGDPQLIGIGDLADDLVDIYRDIKPGLRAWDQNIDDYLPDVVFEWKEPPFRTHWGQHAVDALRVLHNIVYT